MIANNHGRISASLRRVCNRSSARTRQFMHQVVHLLPVSQERGRHNVVTPGYRIQSVLPFRSQEAEKALPPATPAVHRLCRAHPGRNAATPMPLGKAPIKCSVIAAVGQAHQNGFLFHKLAGSWSIYIRLPCPSPDFIASRGGTQGINRSLKTTRLEHDHAERNVQSLPYEGWGRVNHAIKHRDIRRACRWETGWPSLSPKSDAFRKPATRRGRAYCCRSHWSQSRRSSSIRH